MAFDIVDTDRWFDDVLEPLLRSLRCKPVRIDRVEHNDNIDTRIIAEIEKADFVVADLTYARPSVYFEAGYAQRSIPVIYTCRKDHLQPPKETTPESHRVHFDLAMRNIVAWKSPDDPIFADRIAKRIALISRPILAGQKRALEVQQEEEKFRSLSLDGQLVASSAAVRHVLTDRKVTLAGYAEDRAGSVGLADNYLVVGRRVHGSEMIGVQARVAASITLAKLRELRRLLVSPLYDVGASRPSRLVLLRDVLLLVTKNPLPLERMMSALPEFSVVDPTRKQLQLRSELKIPAKRIINVDHVLIRRSSYGAPYVGINAERPYGETEIWPVGAESRGRRDRERIVVPVRTVNRIINVIAIDKVRSIREVEERASFALDACASAPASRGSAD